jgi:hypothetical protein
MLLPVPVGDRAYNHPLNKRRNASRRWASVVVSWSGLLAVGCARSHVRR